MKEILSAYGVPENMIRAFEVYKELLAEKNKSMNLTAVTEEKDIAFRHFLDCLFPLKYADFKNKSVIDVGTGAGFPGIPIKIAEPSVRLTLLDSLNKRIVFLGSVISELGLENVRLMHARAEDAARDMRESFDIATSRAVAALPVLMEYCLPFVKQGGYFIAMKGPEPEKEIQSAERAAEILGGTIERTETYSLADFTHSLVFIKKTQPTPSGYPRSSARIKKKPL